MTSVPAPETTEDRAPRAVNRLYFAAWRWHFYAGLFVIPFLSMLSVTGLYMMIHAKASNELGWIDNVAVTGTALPISVTLDSAVQWAWANGFSGQFKVGVPGSETGVYTVSYDGRNEDTAFPTSDRFVHIDRYTGNILADVGFAEYEPVGKLMALGIALHKGTAGLASFAFNLVYLAAVVFICVSGVVMWWKRKPAGARLGAPPRPQVLPYAKGALLITLALSLAFPLLGLTLLAVMVLDVRPFRRATAEAGAQLNRTRPCRGGVP